MGLTLTLERKGNQGYTIAVGSAALPEIKIDIAALTPEQKANEHLGGRLLLCAAMACFTNTLAADLTQAGVQFKTINARAEIEKEKDSALRTHYSHVDLEVEVDAPEDQQAAFEGVRRGLMGGSLVTYSLEQGIEFDYDIKRGPSRPFDHGSAPEASPPPSPPEPVKSYRGGEGSLFLITAADASRLERLRLLAGDEGFNLLLASDGVYHARAGALERLKALGADKVFVQAEALAPRGLEPTPGVELVDYDRMASLVLEEAERVAVL